MRWTQVAALQGSLDTAEANRDKAAARLNTVLPAELEAAKERDDEEAVEALKSELIPVADMLTPNMPEAAELLGVAEAASDQDMHLQGEKLLALGAKSVLMKGGHGKGEICVDWLIREGQPPVSFSAPRIDTKNTHGTGCTLSSSIAAQLAHGVALEQAVANAHQYLHQAIRAADALYVGCGHGPVHHFYQLWPRAASQ